MMGEKCVRDVIGEPEAWANCITDEPSQPDLRRHIIVDVFLSGKQLALYTLDADGSEALSLFNLDGRDTQERLLRALRPGLTVEEAVASPIE